MNNNGIKEDGGTGAELITYGLRYLEVHCRQSTYLVQH